MAEPGRAACLCAEEREYVATERVGLVVWHLAHGEAMTIRQVADMAGITARGARQMLEKLSRAIPIMCWRGEWMPQVMAEVLYLDELDESDELPA